MCYKTQNWPFRATLDGRDDPILVNVFAASYEQGEREAIERAELLHGSRVVRIVAINAG